MLVFLVVHIKIWGHPKFDLFWRSTKCSDLPGTLYEVRASRKHLQMSSKVPPKVRST